MDTRKNCLSKEYPQSMFQSKNEKIMNTLVNPNLTILIWVVMGSTKIQGHVCIMPFKRVSLLKVRLNNGYSVYDVIAEKSKTGKIMGIIYWLLCFKPVSNKLIRPTRQRSFRREIDKFRAVGYRPVYKLTRVQSCPRAVPLFVLI